MNAGRRRRPASLLEEVNVERDVPIDRDGVRSCSVDVFTPLELPLGPPVIVLHGAAGRREDLTQFAAALTRHGHLVVNASWRFPPDPARLATGIDHLRQASTFARQRIDEPPIVVAWSDAALVAVSALQRHPSEQEDMARLIVLGGYFGWRDVVPSTLGPRGVEFFGDEDPTCWRPPFSELERQPSAPIDVVVGGLDVNRSHGASFADAASRAGWPVVLHVVDGCDHYELVTPRLDGGLRALRVINDLARRGASGAPAAGSTRVVRRS